MPERVFPNQISWVAIVLMKAICSVVAVPSGSDGELLTKVESGVNAEERKTYIGIVDALRHAHSCHDGLGSANEDYNCDEQGVQRVSMVQTGRRKWEQLCSSMGFGMFTKMGWWFRATESQMAQCGHAS